MPITCERDLTRQLTIFVVTGLISNREIAGAIESYLEGQTTDNIIWDFREARPAASRSPRRGPNAGHVEPFWPRRGPGKTALVASSDVLFGLNRMYQSLVEIENLPHSVQTFRSMDEAIAWLDLERKS